MVSNNKLEEKKNTVSSEVIHQYEDMKIPGVRYQEIVALLIEAIKEQQITSNQLIHENVELK